MMWPFCVGRHINVHPHMLITFIKIDARNFFITPGFFTLHMAIENAFSHHKIGNQNISIDVEFVTKTFWFPFMWQLKIINHQSCDDQKFLITNLVVTENFPLLMVWWPKLFLVAIHKVIESFHYRFWSSNWWWIDFHHWFGDKIYYCFVIIKIKPCNLNSFSPLGCIHSKKS